MKKINRKTPLINTDFIDSIESILDRSEGLMLNKNIYVISSSKGLTDKIIDYEKCNYYEAPLCPSDRKVFRNLFINFFISNFGEDLNHELIVSIYPNY